MEETEGMNVWFSYWMLVDADMLLDRETVLEVSVVIAIEVVGCVVRLDARLVGVGSNGG